MKRKRNENLNACKKQTKSLMGGWCWLYEYGIKALN